MHQPEHAHPWIHVYGRAVQQAPEEAKGKDIQPETGKDPDTAVYRILQRNRGLSGMLQA